MYLENVGYRTSYLDDVTIDAAVFRATGCNREQMLRRGTELPAFVLFDPQLYLLDLSLEPEASANALGRLATYPWFRVPVGNYDSGERGGTQRWESEIRDDIETLWANRVMPVDDWDGVVRCCIEFQIEFGASRLILPAASLRDPESTLDAFMALVDAAISTAREVTDKPLLASLPLAESAVAHREPWKSDMVEAIADALSAREQLAGVYLPFLASGDAGPRITNPRVAGALFRLAHLIGSEVGQELYVNFTDALGRALLAFGATGYASSYGMAERRLVRTNFIPGPATPLPKFSSLEVVGDYFPQRDMERIRSERLLRYFTNDRTAHSAPLLDALAAGDSAQSTGTWAETRSNLAAASRHYADLHAERARTSWGSMGEAVDWLVESEARANYLRSRFRDDPLNANLDHVTPWRAAAEAALAHVG